MNRFQNGFLVLGALFFFSFVIVSVSYLMQNALFLKQMRLDDAAYSQLRIDIFNSKQHFPDLKLIPILDEPKSNPYDLFSHFHSGYLLMQQNTKLSLFQDTYSLYVLAQSPPYKLVRVFEKSSL